MIHSDAAAHQLCTMRVSARAVPYQMASWLFLNRDYPKRELDDSRRACLD